MTDGIIDTAETLWDINKKYNPVMQAVDKVLQASIAKSEEVEIPSLDGEKSSDSDAPTISDEDKERIANGHALGKHKDELEADSPETETTVIHDPNSEDVGTIFKDPNGEYFEWEFE